MNDESVHSDQVGNSDERSPSPFARMHAAGLGVDVTPATMDEVVAAVTRTAEDCGTLVIAAHNLHSAYLAHTDSDFASFYENADVILIDGWPVLAAANRERSRHGLPRYPSSFRIGSTDWVSAAIEARKVSRVCVIGASRSSNERFLERHEKANPDSRFLGIPTDPWSSSSLRSLIERVREFKPQLTLVGMGMPLQERVAEELSAAGVRGTIATVGGAIDQLSGAQPYAPRWTGRLRIEWLWRLVGSPRRLGHRYLIEPIKLAAVLWSRRAEKR